MPWEKPQAPHANKNVIIAYFLYARVTPIIAGLFVWFDKALLSMVGSIGESFLLVKGYLISKSRGNLGSDLGSGLAIQQFLRYYKIMARPLRIELAGGLYHVTSHGDRREDIFLCEADRYVWLDIFGGVCKRFNWACHAWCQMTNPNVNDRPIRSGRNSPHSTSTIGEATWMLSRYYCRSQGGNGCCLCHWRLYHAGNRDLFQGPLCNCKPESEEA